jgi:catechol 2,3-dioxygenase-like lactoylglutathione lyase family enzyme
MFQFTHVRLLVADFPACFRFYRDVLGLEVGWGDENDGYADFKTGQTTIALFGRQEMAEAIGAADDQPAA